MKEIRLKLVIFLIVGVISAGVDLLFFNIFLYFTEIFLLSRFFGILTAITFNFFINRNFTFSSKQQSMLKQAPKHFFTYFLVMIVNMIVSKLALSLFGETYFYANVSAFLGILAGIPVSFFLSLYWTFKK